ncbi:MAG: hypothetical protein R3215_10390 [Halomonas sp.]|nr:hypothetical protein [Halomonas sp.]
MSYDISLTDPVTGQTLELDEPHDMRGGTYAVGGTREAWLNITYNYAPHFYELFGDKGIRWLYGKTAAETLPNLEEAVTLLADDVSADYWEPTEGNAKAALCKLIALAQLRPDGVWQGD